MGADKQKAETAQLSTVIGLGLAIAMIVVGVQYEAGTDPNKFCTFSAVDYLYYGGILSLIANGIGILSSIGKWCAMRDGHISAGEKCALGILGFAAFIVLICEIVVLIWGSVVVFGNYADWIYEKAEGAVNPEGYCDYTPMMFAFVILIIKWVLMPATILCACLCACCCAAAA